jgi:hypothetical protein
MGLGCQQKEKKKKRRWGLRMPPPSPIGKIKSRIKMIHTIDDEKMFTTRERREM